MERPIHCDICRSAMYTINVDSQKEGWLAAEVTLSVTLTPLPAQPQIITELIGMTRKSFQVPASNLLTDPPDSSPIGESENVIIILRCVLTLLLNVTK